MTKKFLILLTILWAPSCMQTYNSNTGDEGLTGNCATGSNPKFKPAFTIIKKHCISCHDGYHNGYSSYCTEQAWITAGLVTKGDHMSSSLITIMKNYSGAGTMPKDSPAIPSDEYTSLKDWIDTMP